MSGKLYNATKEKTPETASLSEAVSFLKEHTRSSFDETVELHLHLGVDTGRSDQLVRGSLQLPSGSPSKKTIAVFTDDASQQKSAKEAGATIVGGEELISKIVKDGALNADIAIATPDMMPKLAKIARILGPKGLMPNPKVGTVTPDITAAIEDLSAGKISFKMDQQGNIHESVGKASWEDEKIVSNIEAFLEAVTAARPASTKGELIKSATVCLTMSPGIRIAVSS